MKRCLANFLVGVPLLGACIGLQSLAARPWGPAALPERPPVGPVPPRPRAESPRDALVWAVYESATSGDDVLRASKIAPDAILRGWFKWRGAPPVAEWGGAITEARASSMLFGGGLTCAAVHAGENGLSDQDIADMVTCDASGRPVPLGSYGDVWHGSLSSPAYVDYLVRLACEQVDAGVDHLFFDQIDAGLRETEGFDDHAIADFRAYLLNDCETTSGWSPTDERWGTALGVDPGSPDECPTGDVTTLNYREYLRVNGWQAQPHASDNPIEPLWRAFRSHRDERVWRDLVGRVRTHAAGLGRTVWISANGLASSVDVQAHGSVGPWSPDNRILDLSRSYLSRCRAMVEQGRARAGGHVPLVVFHDWGGNPAFPWLELPPPLREIWLRVRVAEIYAAGGVFAFPVRGPFGCDAELDGTLPEMRRQAAFYQTHRDLFLKSGYLGTEAARVQEPRLSVALWGDDSGQRLQVHVINRQMVGGKLAPLHATQVELPVPAAPTRCVAISPDWPGERPVRATLSGRGLCLTLSRLHSYGIILLEFGAPIDSAALTDPRRVYPAWHSVPPTRTTFRVAPDATVEEAHELNALLHGVRVDDRLRAPQTFRVNALREGRLLVRVRAVANAGARLDYSVDGAQLRSVWLPDLDRESYSDDPEYLRTYAFPIPAGAHQVTLRNTGRDWVSIDWYQFEGEFVAVDTGRADLSP